MHSRYQSKRSYHDYFFITSFKYSFSAHTVYVIRDGWGNTMRKGIVFLLITIFIMLPQVPESASPDTMQMIPDEAIRLRILANSDDEADQRIKRLVRDEVNSYINQLVLTIDDIVEARNLIKEHVPKLEEIVASTLASENVAPIYTVDYRSDVAFPVKMYGNYIYPAGEYEAVLITLGDGVGANWWCVLFPPLCFLDFSNGATVADSDEDVEAETVTEAEDEKEMEIEEVGQEDKDEEEQEVEVRFFLLDWLGLS